MFLTSSRHVCILFVEQTEEQCTWFPYFTIRCIIRHFLSFEACGEGERCSAGYSLFGVIYLSRLTSESGIKYVDFTTGFEQNSLKMQHK